MLNVLYNAMYIKLDYLETKLKDVEDEIFNEHEREMVFELSQISRRLMSFRQTIGSHESAIKNLRIGIKTAFNKDYSERLEKLDEHYRSLNRRIYVLDHILSDLRETNQALLSTKQNEIMKLFTILAFITFPLTLFTSMFGMNTITTPIVGQEGDFWLILSIMAFVSIFFFAYFKYRKWI